MDGTLLTIIPVICTVIALIISIKSYFKTDKKDDKTETEKRIARDTKIDTKLDLVLKGNDDLKGEIKGINNSIELYREKLARVDESCKQAHKRIDTLEARTNKCVGGKQYGKD